VLVLTGPLPASTEALESKLSQVSHSVLQVCDNPARDSHVTQDFWGELAPGRLFDLSARRKLSSIKAP